jgi:CMP-2-keto-3-deoxyoctulosonic acid synthetase
MLGIDDEQIIVNVQGDEPMLGEQVIKQVANNLANSKMQMATLCENVLDVLHQNPPHFEKQELARVKNIVPCQIYQIPLSHNLGLNIVPCLTHSQC